MVERVSFMRLLVEGEVKRRVTKEEEIPKGDMTIPFSFEALKVW